MESGQILVGAVFLLIACTLFLFSVYDISLAWRDRAKIQQAVDTAALSSGALICDVLTLMKIYNFIAKFDLIRIPHLVAIGEGIDAMRVVIEKFDFIGPLTGIVGSDTHYAMMVVSKPKLDAYYHEGLGRFVFTSARDPGRRVLTIGGTVTTLSDRYLFKRYANRSFSDLGVLVVTAKVGVFTQKGSWGLTYVPVLLD